MALAYYPSALEEVTLPVAADPSVVAVNPPEALSRYLETSDPDVLAEVPVDASRVVLRPLTPERLAEARRAAGHRPWLADSVREGLRAATDAERSEMLRAERKAGRARATGADGAEGLADEYRAALRRYDRAYSLAVDALSDAEREALRSDAAWTERYHRAVLVASFVRMVDPGLAGVRVLDLLDGLRPLDVQVAFRHELVTHALNLSTLPPVGKAPSPSGCGSEGASASFTNGGATIATDEDSGAPGAIAEGLCAPSSSGATTRTPTSTGGCT